jgi:alkaline phosphatase
VGPSGRRIVVSYGSNPVTNGNGDALGGTPGNHTPQDILTYADDNVNGTFASRITGHGLMDNTDIAPIMEDFLGVNIFSGSLGIDNPTQGTHGTDGDIVAPNPVPPVPRPRSTSRPVVAGWRRWRFSTRSASVSAVS